MIGGEVASTRRAIDEAIDGGHITAARRLLDKLWRDHPGPSSASFVNARLPRLAADTTMASASVTILRSFTLEPIVPLLRAAAALNGLDLSIQLGGFNAAGQEMLDPASGLYSSPPDVAIVALQTRDVAPDLWASFADLTPADVELTVRRVVADLQGMVASFRRWSTAPLVIHNLEQPLHRAMGVSDHLNGGGQEHAIASINAALVEIARATPDVHVLDYDALVAVAGRHNWFDRDKWTSMRMPIRAEHLADLALEWLRFIQPLVGLSSKVLIVDLDNTLWGGVLGEDLVDGLRVAPEGEGAAYWSLQRSIRDLLARGVLLAICSKNDEADVKHAFQLLPDMVLRWDDFAAVRVNWDNKADNLRSIAAELNIGLDAVAFLDDNPVECELIRHELPMVTVLELDDVEATDPVRGNPWFSRLSRTREDAARGAMYAQQRERLAAEVGATTLDDFLASLDMSVELRPMTTATRHRVAQLIQKTNQFNLTTRRYGEAELDLLASDPNVRIDTASSRDRFGDHGLIGVVISRLEDQLCEIDSMLLSCRVIGRGVDTAMLAIVCSEAAARGAARVRGTFVPTPKNGPAESFFESHGFVLVESVAGVSSWNLELSDGFRGVPSWIRVNVEEGEVSNV